MLKVHVDSTTAIGDSNGIEIKARYTAIDEKKVAANDTSSTTTQSLSQTQPTSKTRKGPHFKHNLIFTSRRASQITLRKKINFIHDDDRTIINDALRAKLNPKHIETLLKDYPNACKSGGCVDHINHPINIACEFHHAAVRAILKAGAGQRDENKGRLPLEIFLTNVNMIDVTTEESTKVVDALCKSTQY